MNEISRRTFLGTTAALAASTLIAQELKSIWKVGGFTKVLQELDFEKTAAAAVELGWDGIELPLRAKGHILPEKVDDDLPRLVEALKSKGLEVMVAATDIRGTDEPNTEKVLRALAKHGIRLYRHGGYKYKEGVSIAKQIAEFRAKVKDLAALNKEIGVTGLYQNHSGNGYVGASVWDIHEMIQDLDPRHFGVHFDIGHATVEGGLSWPTSFALVKDRIGALIVKDFYWKHTPGEGGKTVWVPISQGTVNPKFFKMLKASGFAGPITMQFEYPFEGEGLEAKMKALKADNLKLREWLKV
jgi:sugar phosphate isomerase/epimerase